MIKFQITIDVPGNLDVADELSNLLQGQGEKKDLRNTIIAAIWDWAAIWMPHVSFSAFRIKVEQE